MNKIIPIFNNVEDIMDVVESNDPGWILVPSQYELDEIIKQYVNNLIVPDSMHKCLHDGIMDRIKRCNRVKFVDDNLIPITIKDGAYKAMVGSIVDRVQGEPLKEEFDVSE